RLADRFNAHGNTIANKRTIFFGKDLEHGLTDELCRQIPELFCAEGINVQDRSYRIDHEVHNRVMLEYFAPLFLAVARICLAAPEPVSGLKSTLPFLEDFCDQVRSDYRGNKESNNHRKILRIVDPKIESSRCREVGQSNRHDGKHC